MANLKQYQITLHVRTLYLTCCHAWLGQIRDWNNCTFFPPGIVVGICFFLLMILFVALIIGFGIYRSKED